VHRQTRQGQQPYPDMCLTTPLLLLLLLLLPVVLQPW
jgi:hypothetical protein